MVVSPYYTKPSQEQLYLHFKNVAESVNIHIMVYDIPIFARVNMNPETLSRLAKNLKYCYNQRKSRAYSKTDD